MEYGQDVLKNGMKGDAVEELQIRLAGFSGGIPDGDFGPGTVNQVKQFQKDFMKLNSPGGEVDQATFAAIDRFAAQYPVPFDKLKCPCGKCSGFGRGLFKGQYRDGKPKIEAYNLYEYPGIHRVILWAYRAVLHYHPQYSFTINSGYRCSENNIQNGRQSTNHHGKAIDLDVPDKAGEDKTDDRARCNAIRQSIVEKSNAQIGWPLPNKKSLEPENIAPTWVHYDVRQFAPKYLEDRFFCKTSEELDKLNPITVSASNQSAEQPETVVEQPKPTIRYVEGVVTATTLYVRAKPQADGALVGKVSKNDMVQVSEKINEWFAINYKGTKAYVSTNYVKLKSDLG